MKRKCSQRACHCKMTKWSSWSTCSTRCGGGVQYKSRQILAKPSAGGRACGRTSRHRLCNMHDCAPECGVSAWSAWSDCSKTRTIGNSKLEHCPTNTKQKKACNTQQCHCVLSQWSPWSKCDGVCGSGAVQSRKRFPLAGSKDCKDYDLTQTRSCPNQPPCPAQCEVSSWSKFSTTCSRSCGGGVFKQTRFVNGPEAICGDVVSEQTKPCNQHACPHRADLRRIVAAVRQMSKRTRTSSEAFAEFMAEALKVSGGNSNSQSRFRNRVSERNCAKLYPVFTR
jgi:hypothetical protein